MTKEKILIVEDEKDIIKMLEYNLKKEGFRTISANDGEDAIDLAMREHPDIVLLDLMLPGIDGLEVCKSLKAEKKTKDIPIIMLTAKSQESDKILGLELGADDYVTKPFSPRELLARIKAVFRRIQEKPKEKVLVAGSLEMDTGKHLVTIKKKAVELTSKEYDLLKVLMEVKGRALSREFLL